MLRSARIQVCDDLGAALKKSAPIFDMEEKNMSVDLKKLRENLENLTGKDYMEIARVSGMNINLG